MASERKYSNDTISIVDLAKIIWNGKYILTVITLMFFFSAMYYAVNAKEWWTSSAIVQKPQPQQLLDIKNKLPNFYSAFSEELDSSKIKKINEMLDPVVIFDMYISEFNSYDTKSEFIKSNILTTSEMNGVNNDEVIRQLAGKIKAELPERKNKNIYSLSFEANSPEMSHNYLVKYSAFVNEKIKSDIVSSLEGFILQNIGVLNSKLSSLELKARDDIKLEVMKTLYSLELAKYSNVSEPLQQLYSEDVFSSIQLGSKALERKLEILKETNELSLFRPEINDLKVKIELLKKITISNDIKFNSVRYLKSNDFPETKDKRMLIVLIGVFLGIITSLCVIFVLFSFTKDK